MNRLALDFPESSGVHASLFCVQPWLDFSPVGGSVVVTDFTHNEAVGGRARALAERVWSIRREFKTDWTSPERVVERIAATERRPVLISEAYDSPTSGSSGDNPTAISLLLPHARELKSCFYIVDPEFVARSQAAGVGETVEGDLGCGLDRRFAHPLRMSARVERLTDGEFVAKGPAFTGRQFSMGPCAVLAIDNLRILAASKPVMMIDPELYRSQGIEPSDCDAVGVKSALLFRAAYESISPSVLYLDAPGPSRGRLSAVAFDKINRPVYPLDDFDWTPGAVQRIGARLVV
jgi:microcystin degradation protein MlrC